MGITEEHIESLKKWAEILESCGKAAGGMSSELDALLQDNQQMEQQIESLNEANDRLRERLNRSENHDGYMKLPLDADGEPIRIGDEMNVDSKCLTVIGYEMQENKLHLLAREDGAYLWTLDPAKYKHFKHDTAPLDSWEKLEEDAKKAICKIAGQKAFPSCAECKWVGKECNKMARLEILKRAKKLAGIEEDEQR